jgi:predicted component of type VI protein secretion system
VEGNAVDIHAKEFLAACGLKGPMRLTVDSMGAEALMRHALWAPYAIVGRHPTADLVLQHPAVSRRHVYFQFLAGRLFCVDLESRSGTGLQDRKKGSSWLKPYQSIQLGPFRIQVTAKLLAAPHDQPDAPSPLEAQTSTDEQTPEVVLEFLHGKAVRSRWRMGRPLALVGRSDRCKVQLVGPEIPRFQGSLVRTRVGAWFIDFRGSALVNGNAFHFARLEDGDEIEVGSFLMRVRYETTFQDKAKVFAPPARSVSPVAGADNNRSASDAASRSAKNALTQRRRPIGSGNPPLAQPPADEVSHLPLVPLIEVTRGSSLPNVGGEGSEQALLWHLVTQLALGQQHMLAQQQQMMSLLTQFLVQSNTEQKGLVGQELIQLQHVTRELEDLQLQVNGQPHSVHETPVHPPERAPTPPERPTAEGALVQPVAAPTGKAEPAPSPVNKPAAATANQHSLDTHLKIMERMGFLQREQQTRWQRVLNYLRGKASG